MKYLYTLDKFFGPLIKCSPVCIQTWCGTCFIISTCRWFYWLYMRISWIAVTWYPADFFFYINFCFFLFWFTTLKSFVLQFSIYVFASHFLFCPAMFSLQWQNYCHFHYFQQTEMVEHIPSLMNAIRMIHSISQYYNTSERMTSLFVKVTNQMITTCKAYINRDVMKIWEHSRYALDTWSAYSWCCSSKSNLFGRLQQIEYQASLVEPWSIFWQDPKEPKYPVARLN